MQTIVVNITNISYKCQIVATSCKFVGCKITDFYQCSSCNRGSGLQTLNLGFEEEEEEEEEKEKEGWDLVREPQATP